LTISLAAFTVAVAMENKGLLIFGGVVVLVGIFMIGRGLIMRYCAPPGTRGASAPGSAAGP
jgi:hypothetical protein